MQRLIKNGAQVDQHQGVCAHAAYILMYNIYCSCMYECSLLYLQILSIFPCYQDRSTPLMVHAEAGRTEVVRELISQAAPLDAQDQVTNHL